MAEEAVASENLKHIEGAFRFTHFSANGKEDQFTNENF